MSSHRYDAIPDSEENAEQRQKTVRRAKINRELDEAESAQATRKSTQLPSADMKTTDWIEGNCSIGDSDDEESDFVLQVSGNLDSKDGPNPSIEHKIELDMPPGLPGGEARRLELPKNQGGFERAVDATYPELPKLADEPVPLPGPNGKPYALSDLQSMAAASSPQLRQAVADVEVARGNLIQAKTYQNPTVGYLFDPANNNATAQTMGIYVDQTVRTGGKQKLSVAMAQMDLENSEQALRRARNDLSTAVRNAYFTLLVDKETLVVTRSLARFTDDIYRTHTGLLRGALAAPYEPASLRAQAFNARLMHNQAIASYVYDWKKLVSIIGERHLPLTEISGKVDRLIPYFDYDEILAYMLTNHSDVIVARNSLAKSQYNLKLARVIPFIPDIDFRGSLERDNALLPFGTYSAVSVSAPIAVWDRNTGNIIAAQADVARSSEEAHRVEVALTGGLADAYANYQNNLYAIDYYRRYILPDLVRYYRGVYARRQVDPASSFGDLVAAQQNLATNITSYLAVLQNLWTSVVTVADFLQTDDLFQVAQPRSLPEIPDLNQLPPWPCGHPHLNSCPCDSTSGHDLASTSKVSNASRVSVGQAKTDRSTKRFRSTTAVVLQTSSNTPNRENHTDDQTNEYD